MICWSAALYTTILSVNLDTCILNGLLVYLPSIWLTVMSNELERMRTCWMCRKPIFCLQILWIFKYIDCTLSHLFQFYKTEWHHICSADVHWNIVVLMCVHVLELSVITLLENFFIVIVDIWLSLIFWFTTCRLMLLVCTVYILINRI